MKKTVLEQRRDRIAKANQLIEFIGQHGRRFFYYKKEGRYSYFKHVISNSQMRIYYVDKYTNADLPLTHTNSKRWNIRFSDGGTLKRLIIDLADYIRTGKFLPSHSLGPWPEWVCDGDLWGYGEDMAKVRAEAERLGIIGRLKQAQMDRAA